MSPQQFDEWALYEQIEPSTHCAKMLGFIAHMLAGYMGGKAFDADESLKFCMPWVYDDSTGDEVAACVFKGLKR